MKIARNRDDGDHEEYLFECQGCGYSHRFVVRWGGLQKEYHEERKHPMPTWEFNGDTDNPTFSPSLLYLRNGQTKRCHLFLRNGIIEYLDDCEHEFAGKKVPLRDL